eukprot:761639_1
MLFVIYFSMDSCFNFVLLFGRIRLLFGYLFGSFFGIELKFAIARFHDWLSQHMYRDTHYHSTLDSTRSKSFTITIACINNTISISAHKDGMHLFALRSGD